MTDDSDPVEKLRRVEEAYGRAMLRAHGFERAIATLLVCKLPQTIHEAKAQELVDEIRSLPLGLLIKRFRTEYQPPEQVTAALSLILTKRNDLTHRISEAIERATLQREWDQVLVPELDQASSLFEQHMPMMREYLAQAHRAVGLDQGAIEAEIRKRYPGAPIDA